VKKNNASDFVVVKSGRKSGLLLILVSLAFFILPEFYYSLLFGHDIPLLVGWVVTGLAGLVFVVAVVKILKNSKYVFLISRDRARQSFTGNSAYDFDIALEDIVGVEVAGPPINTDQINYYIMLEDGQRHEIVMINGSSPKTIVKAIKERLGL